MEKARGSRNVIYYNKEGTPIDPVEWLRELDTRHEVIDVHASGSKPVGIIIRTRYWGFDPYRHRRLPGEPPEIYETEVTGGWSHPLPTWHATMLESQRGHEDISRLQERMLDNRLLRFWMALRYVIVTLRDSMTRPFPGKMAYIQLLVWVLVTLSATYGLAGTIATESWGFAALNALVLCLDVRVLIWSAEGIQFLRTKRHLEKSDAPAQ